MTKRIEAVAITSIECSNELLNANRKLQKKNQENLAHARHKDPTSMDAPTSGFLHIAPCSARLQDVQQSASTRTRGRTSKALAAVAPKGHFPPALPERR